MLKPISRIVTIVCKYTQQNRNISQNIEECVCYMPRKEAKSENIPYFVTGIGGCLNIYAAL